MPNKVFIKAEEIAEELGVSKPYAYKLVRQMNEELEEKGYIVVAGRTSRKFYMEKVYGAQKNERRIKDDCDKR